MMQNTAQTTAQTIESIYNGQPYETSLDKPTLTFHASKKCKKCHGKGYMEYNWPHSYQWTITCECIDKKLSKFKHQK